MTFSEEFTTDQNSDFLEGESPYPVAFGITFTPPVTGIALGLLGLLAAIYVLFTFFMPAWTNYNTLKADQADKQAKVDQQKSGKLDQKMLEVQAELQRSQATRNKVLSLFSSENSLKTLLLDMNNFVEARQLKLVSFKPELETTVVTDGSLGEAVNNRLKRQSIQVEVEGDFEKTHEWLRDLERLQPLLILKELSSQLVEEKSADRGNIKTSFTLDAILPLTREEIAKLTPPPEENKAPAEGNKPPENPSGQPAKP